MADIDWSGAIESAMGDDLPDSEHGANPDASELTDESGQQAPAASPEVQGEAFFDPQTLSPELQEQWKRMQAAYTRRSQVLASQKKELGITEERLKVVDRFFNDTEFARGVVEKIAPELGYELRPKSGTPAPQGTQLAILSPPGRTAAGGG